MLIDITLKITPEMVADDRNNPKKELEGHLGTHFDVMNKEFPPEDFQRAGLLFDVRKVGAGEISLADVDLEQVQKGMFACFYTGYIEKDPYGSATYFKEHPQLSKKLIEALLEKEISIIGLDCGGIRRGKEHTPMDQYCADRGVFVIENLCNLGAVLQAGGRFTAHTYPMNFVGLTGLPCRVLAEV